MEVRGGFGVVRLQGRFAYKRFKSWKPEWCTDAVRELCALHRFHNAPGILAIASWSLTPGELQIVLPRCKHSLAQRLSRGALPRIEWAQLWACLLAALPYLHRTGYMHRDLTPANVLKCRRGFKVSDFGSCVRFVAGRSYTIAVTTYVYSAPEMLFGDGLYTPNVDWWSAGLVLYEARTGTRVLRGTTRHAIQASTRDFLARAPAPHGAAERLVLARMLVPDAAQRWSTHACARDDAAPHHPVATTLSVAHRDVVWGWMREFAHEVFLPEHVITHACSMIRAVLATDTVAIPRDLQLLACACMHVAQLLYDSHSVEPFDYVHYSDKAFTLQDFYAMLDQAMRTIAPIAYRLAQDEHALALYTPSGTPRKT